MACPDSDVVGVGEEDDADGAPLLAVVHLVAPEYLAVPETSSISVDISPKVARFPREGQNACFGPNVK